MSRRNGNKTFNSATRSALADSLAGVAGSLMSMLMFYPVDVYKTNLQAGKAPADEHDPFPGSTTSGQCIDIRRRNNLSTSMYTIRLLLSSYRGVHYKIAHTITSSFAYFFIYSWITSHHRSRLASRGETENGKEFEYRPSTTARLFLAAVAAMLNTALTLPLDVLSARKQTGSDNKNRETETSTIDSGSRDAMDIAWSAVDAVPSRTTNSVRKGSHGTFESGYVTASDGGDDHAEEEKKTEDGSKLRGALSYDADTDAAGVATSVGHKSNEGTGGVNSSLTTLWAGLVPSLLLCSNPSIHYTVFDSIKASVLRRKRYQGNGSMDRDRLTMCEAFVVGLLAKFAATIATYPLIRAKIMLMCSDGGTGGKDTMQKKHGFRRGDSVLDFSGRVGDSKSSNEKEARDVESETDNNLWRVLRGTFRREGVAGLYRGCNLQLIHTVLKSALIMMVRERIIVTTRKLVGA